MQFHIASNIELKSIKGHGCFTEIYQHSKKYRAGGASVAVVFTTNAMEYVSTDVANWHTIHFGVTIGKRYAKKAVVRNRIKRLLREALCIVVSESATSALLRIDKLIISYYNAPTHPMQIHLDDVLPDIRKIWQQICK
ncbi:MAG: ribonuclease P protein component [Ignavibacteria bacterium]|jgi:ribonuclease P protein component|nr:ribonuclease P protein component [Ignavibacteria bacterium]